MQEVAPRDRAIHAELAVASNAGDKMQRRRDVSRLLKDKAGAVPADLIQTIAEDIAEHAARIAKHSGRKTVQESDIRLASKQ